MRQAAKNSEIETAARHPKGTGSEPRFPSVAELSRAWEVPPEPGEWGGLSFPTQPVYSRNSQVQGESAVLEKQQSWLKKRVAPVKRETRVLLL